MILLNYKVLYKNQLLDEAILVFRSAQVQHAAVSIVKDMSRSGAEYIKSISAVKFIIPLVRS